MEPAVFGRRATPAKKFLIVNPVISTSFAVMKKRANLGEVDVPSTNVIFLSSPTTLSDLSIVI